jgi:hypothetical protein
MRLVISVSICIFSIFLAYFGYATWYCVWLGLIGMGLGLLLLLAPLHWKWFLCASQDSPQQKSEYSQTFLHDAENVSQIPVAVTWEPVRPFAVMDKVRLFFASMFSEWGSGLSGPASVPFVILALFAPSAVQKAAYGVLAVLLGLFSAYRIWLKEHLALEGEKAKNQNPQLRGEIDQVFIGNTVDTDGQEPIEGSVILIWLKAWNTVQMPEFSIYKYDLAVTIDGPAGPVTFAGIQGEWTINMKVGSSFSVRHMSIDRLKPMRYIDPQCGAVGFYVRELSPDPRSVSEKSPSMLAQI